VEEVELRPRTGATDVADMWLTGVAVAPSGEFVVRLGCDRLAWVYRPRETPCPCSTCQTFRRGCRPCAMRNALPGKFGRRPDFPVDRILATYRSRPMGLLAREDSFDVDQDGRIWAISHRPARDSTYLEVFDRTGHLAAIRIPDHALGLRTLGSWLMVLLEGREEGPDGLHPRYFAWFRIAGQHRGTGT
jgi:hypothetical protein